MFLGFLGGSDSKESTCNVWNPGSIPGLERSPGGGDGNPLHYSCLVNPHGQRNLAGYSLWGSKESDTTERLSTHNLNIHRFKNSQLQNTTIKRVERKRIKVQPWGFPSGSVVKNLLANAGDMDSLPGPGRSHVPRGKWAPDPQLLHLSSKPRLLSPRAATTEGRAPQQENSPCWLQLEKSLLSNKDTAQPKINKKKNFFKCNPVFCHSHSDFYKQLDKKQIEIYQRFLHISKVPMSY